MVNEVLARFTAHNEFPTSLAFPRVAVPGQGDFVYVSTTSAQVVQGFVLYDIYQLLERTAIAR